jgi:hypothetical protein
MSNHTYIASYLTNVERQLDGWPKGVGESEKKWLTRAVMSVFRLHQMRGTDKECGLSLAQVHERMRGLVDGLESGGEPDWLFPRASVMDFRLACVHRALLEADAEPVWILSSDKMWSQSREEVK